MKHSYRCKRPSNLLPDHRMVSIRIALPVGDNGSYARFGVETVTYMTIRFKLDDPLEPPVVRDNHVIKVSTLL